MISARRVAARHRSPKGGEAMSHLDFMISLLNVGIRAAQLMLVVFQIYFLLKKGKSKRDHKKKKNRRS